MPVEYETVQASIRTENLTPQQRGAELVNFIVTAAQTGEIPNVDIEALVSGGVQLTGEDAKRLVAMAVGTIAQPEVVDISPEALARADIMAIMRAIMFYNSEEPDTDISEVCTVVERRRKLLFAGANLADVPEFTDAQVGTVVTALRARIRALICCTDPVTNPDELTHDQSNYLGEAGACYDALLGLTGQREDTFLPMSVRLCDPAWRTANADLVSPWPPKPPVPMGPSDAEHQAVVEPAIPDDGQANAPSQRWRRFLGGRAVLAVPR